MRENGMDSAKIRDLSDADAVATLDPSTRQLSPSPVHNFFTAMPKRLIRVTLQDGRSIKLTPEHPLLARSSSESADPAALRGDWLPAEQLKCSMHSFLVLPQQQHINDPAAFEPAAAGPAVDLALLQLKNAARLLGAVLSRGLQLHVSAPCELRM